MLAWWLNQAHYNQKASFLKMRYISDISSISQTYLRYTSSIFQAHLRYISGLSWACLRYISGRDRKNIFWLAAKIFWAKMAVNFFIPICHFKLYFSLGEPVEPICLDSRPLCCHNWSSKRKSMIYFW